MIYDLIDIEFIRGGIHGLSSKNISYNACLIQIKMTIT